MAYKDGLIFDTGIDIGRDIYTVLGIPPTADGYNINYACGNAHDKINKKSAIKPYEYDYPGELTDAMRKAINYGMTPVYVNINTASQMGSGIWGQWTPPTTWMRWTDFGGYYQKAEKHVTLIKMWSENPDGLPIVASDKDYRASWYTGSLTLSKPNHQLLLTHFHNGADVEKSNLGTMRLTLWVGSWKKGVGFTRDGWAAQSELTLNEWMAKNPNGGTWNVYLNTTAINDTTAGGIGSLKNAIDAADGSIVAIGLAPTYGVFDSTNPEKPLPFARLGPSKSLVSLRMYPDDFMDHIQVRTFANDPHNGPAYATIGDNVNPAGAYPVYVVLDRYGFNPDYNTNMWGIIPASRATWQDARTVNVSFKDTVLVKCVRESGLPSSTKARLTACLERFDSYSNKVLETVEIRSVERRADAYSREFRFTPEDFLTDVDGEVMESIPVSFKNNIGSSIVRLRYRLDPDDVVFYNVNNQPMTDGDAYITSPNKAEYPETQYYPDLSTAAQTFTNL